VNRRRDDEARSAVVFPEPEGPTSTALPYPRSTAVAEVVLGLRPESLELGADGIPAEVEVVEELGADAYVFCTARLHDGSEGQTRLVARAEAKAAPARGERVALRVRPGEAHVFDAEIWRAARP
jgi:multiple sugar transport system ATP-binding protein